MMIQPLFFEKFARQLREAFDAASGLPSPENDRLGAAAMIIRELMWEEKHRPSHQPDCVFHHFLFEVLHLYDAGIGDQHGHAIASSSAVAHALRHQADERDIQDAKLALAQFCPLFIDLRGSHVIAGWNWTLDAVIIDTEPEYPKIWAILRSVSTGNYRRLTWQVSYGPEDVCYLDEAYPSSSPEIQMLFKDHRDETLNCTASLVLQPGGVAGIKSRIENLAWLLSAWLYRAQTQKDGSGRRQPAVSAPFLIELQRQPLLGRRLLN